MDDAEVVSRLERVDDLSRNRERSVQRQGPARDDVREVLAGDELHDERASGRLSCSWGGQLLDGIDLRDVGVIE
jgi:hypothetical protein